MTLNPAWRRRAAAAGFSGLLVMALLFAIGAAPPATTCFGQAPTIPGATAGDDTLTGTAGADVIVGLGGNDTISGLGGADRICGDDGNDVIRGAGGKDRLDGGAGNDRLSGGAGADLVLGGEGADTLAGLGGDDHLAGGGGTDDAAGGPGTDTCVAETRATCEVLPPNGCTTPALVPAAVDATNVTVVGSNAFAHHSSLGMCTGGVCDYDYLDFRAEVRNGTGSSIRLGEATILIYNGAGELIGRRFAGFEAGALAPGERTVLTESMPSMLYGQGEYNHFPTGWRSWELEVRATVAAPTSYDDRIIGSRVSSLTRDSGGEVTAEGAAVNTLGSEINDVNWWVVLYDGSGRLINAATAFDFLYPESLAPGGEAPLSITVYSWEPTCFATVRWGASGS